MKRIKYMVAAVAAAIVLGCAAANAADAKSDAIESQWKAKHVAFIGDSITDKVHVGTKKNYWQYLDEMLGIVPHVYGINGDTYKGVIRQAEKLKAERGTDIDAVFVFLGTNDFNGGLPLGNWYEIKDDQAPIANGKTEIRKRRIAAKTLDTFRGRINIAMEYLKSNFPDAQIIVLTPIHRGFAKFSANNVQPDESFPNRIGLYIDDYVNVVKETATVWAVPVIDLNSICGIYPNLPAHAKFLHNQKTDLLHPNAAGHYRMAKAIAYQLLAFPADFK